MLYYKTFRIKCLTNVRDDAGTISFPQPLSIPIFLTRSDTETKQNTSKLYV